jgi:hypothetical protein
MAVIMCKYPQGDLEAIGDMDEVEFLMTAPRVYDATHITRPAVETYRIKAVGARAQRRLLLQAERQVGGEAPLIFQIAPSTPQMRV